MTNQQTPEIYTLHAVPNKGERPWSGIYTVRADAEHDAKVMREVTGRHWSVVRLVVADTNDRVPEAWTNLLAYVLQDELHNRLTPRVIDIAYTAFMQAKRPNDEDGGASDWFNDTRPVVRELIAKLRKDLIKELAGASQPVPSATVALSDDLRDGLVAISKAIADQDDRAAQAMLREILAAPKPATCGNTPYDEGPFTLEQPVATTTQAAPAGGETYHLGACIVDGVLYATMMRKERGCSGVATVLFSEQIPVEHLQDRDVIFHTGCASHGQAPAAGITVEQVEDAIGLQSTAWDTIGAEKIVEAVLRLANAKAPAAGAVAGEPIGHLYCGGSYGDELADWEIVADQHQCDKLNEHHGALGKEAKLPIYAAQQPTQAQAGAVPLTLRWCAHCGEGVTNFCRSKPAGDCPIGLPHIKGGQHVGKVD